MTVLRSRLLRPRLLGRGGAGQVATSPLNVALGHPGHCPAEATLFIGIFDDSASMLGGNDSTGLRYAEAALALDRVARRCRCRRELAALLHMNKPCRADRKPRPIHRRLRGNLTAGLVVPTDGDGASEMTATLQRAARLAADHPGHRTVLAAFSDYELVDDPSRLADDLAAFPGDVHAVVMRSQPPQALLPQDAITVHHIATGAAPGAVARSLFDALTTYRPGRRPVPDSPKDPTS